jgi:phage I-like protein
MRNLCIVICNANPLASRDHIAFLATLIALAPDTNEIQLMPAGEFRAIDGRPGKGKAWQMDAKAAQALIALHGARANPLAIDYEHQTFKSEENGQPAPAAGWIQSLEWREGQGLFAKVQWTERAKQMIAAGEYKYISPAFKSAPEGGAPKELLPAALVNYPAIDGMQEVALSAIAEKFNRPSSQENSMKELLAAVLAALGLKEDVKQEDAVKAIATLKADAGKKAELETQITTLKATAPDPAKYVPIDSVKELQTQVATLTAANQGREVNELVTTAIAEGKLLPAMEKWARDLGKKSVADLKGYLDNAAPIAALSGTQTRGRSAHTSGDGKDPAVLAKAAQKLMDEEAKAGRQLSSAEAVERASAAA